MLFLLFSLRLFFLDTLKNDVFCHMHYNHHIANTVSLSHLFPINSFSTNQLKVTVVHWASKEHHFMGFLGFSLFYFYLLGIFSS